MNKQETHFAQNKSENKTLEIKRMFFQRKSSENRPLEIAGIFALTRSPVCHSRTKSCRSVLVFVETEQQQQQKCTKTHRDVIIILFFSARKCYIMISFPLSRCVCLCVCVCAQVHIHFLNTSKSV